jgi:hypothetical protein
LSEGTRRCVQAFGIDVGQHDGPARSTAAGNRNPHTADTDDDQNFVVHGFLQFDKTWTLRRM